MQKPSSKAESPARVAGLGLIRVAVQNTDGTSNLILQGLSRVELAGSVQIKPYRIHKVRPLAATPVDNVMVDALTAKIRDLIVERVQQGQKVHVPFLEQLVASLGTQADQEALSVCSLNHFLKYLDQLEDPDQISDLVSWSLLTDVRERQTLLETVELEPRLKQLIHFLMAEIRHHKKNDHE